jgi:hypothetical protein
MTTTPTSPPIGTIATVTAPLSMNTEWNDATEVLSIWTISYKKPNHTYRNFFNTTGSCHAWCVPRGDNTADEGKSFLMSRTEGPFIFTDLSTKFGAWVNEQDAFFQTTDDTKSKIPMYIYINKGGPNEGHKIERMYVSDEVRTNCRKDGNCYGVRVNHPTWEFGKLTQYNITGAAPTPLSPMEACGLYHDPWFEDKITYTFRFSSSMLTTDEMNAYGTITPDPPNPNNPPNPPGGNGKGLSRTTIIAIVVGSSIVGIIFFVILFAVIALLLLRRRRRRRQ